MPISRSPSVGFVQEQADALCWGAWTELGVSGWGRTHQDWAIDPEPLIMFTVTAVEDSRLLDEATDWCIHNWRHLSQTRLRHIVSRQSKDHLSEWGHFAATVNKRSGAHFPSETTQWTAYKLTGRSTLRPFGEPSMVLLRMRAMFGIGARTEILRDFLFHPSQRATAAMLADITNYAKRNVAESCELLVQAGLLSSKSVGNRYYFSLASHSSLERFVGATPKVAPDWNALLRVVGAILRNAEIATETTLDALVVETHETIREISDDLDALGIDAPRRLRGAAVLEEWNSWVHHVMADLASGSWPGERTDQTVRPMTTTHIRRSR